MVYLALSRLVYMKNAEDTIVAWRSKPRDILRVFDVRPIPFLLTSLTTRFQAELAIDTHVAVPDTQVAVLNTQNIALEVQRTLAEHVAGARKPSVGNYFFLSFNGSILTAA